MSERADIVEGLVTYYEELGGGVERLNQDIAQVTRELLDGVSLTSVHFDSGGGAGVSNRTPKEMLSLLVQVKRALRGMKRVDSARAGFSGRFLST